MTVTWRTVALVLAIVAAVIFTLMGFDWWTYSHPLGFLGLAVTLGLVSRLP